MRIVIELKRGSDPSIVLNNLYRLTALQSTFSCNMVGILNGQPKQMGLKELLQFMDELIVVDGARRTMAPRAPGAMAYGARRGARLFKGRRKIKKYL
ncbi:UNVERIFIED_CONTAM: DNA gyrase subunit A, chloroplastic/mitochondrial [Sesamum radiatum]|uniref:DNA gyrase subunit A, chloroplastic/mitochondrial n=1 Tax=Sesamum radiatum TaxID=300843 RepID=A0AAW2VNX3_SESRA